MKNANRGKYRAILRGSNFKDRYEWHITFIDDMGTIIDKENGFVNNPLLIHTSVGGAELKAAVEAIVYARKNKLLPLIIEYRHDGIRKWATGEWKAYSPVTKLYADFMKKFVKWISFDKGGKAA